MKSLIIQATLLCAMLVFSSTSFSQNNSKVKDIGRKSLSGVTTINDLVGINRYILVDGYTLTLAQVEEETVYIRSYEFDSFEDNLSDIIEKANEGDLLYVENIRCTFKDKCWWETPLKMTLIN